MDEPDDPRDHAEWAREVMDGYEAVAAAYDANRDPTAERAHLAAFTAQIDAGERVLDAGCGGGRAVLETLGDGVEAVGLDLSAAQLALARERAPTASFVRGDVLALPFADDAFDAVSSLHAVIHVPREHHESVFAEFARVCRPGGHVLFALGAGAWEGTNDDWLDSGAAMRWSFHGGDRNRELLRGAGFEIDEAAVVDDELGEGEWLFVRGRLPP